MIKLQSQALVLPLSLLVLLNPINVYLLSPSLAQNTNCQQQKQQDIELQINLLISSAEQNINTGSHEQAIAQLSQAVKIALAAKNPIITSNFLNQMLDVHVVHESIKKSVQQTQPSQKQRVNQLLMSIAQLTQSLNSGQSFVKTRSFTKIAHYLRIISEPNQAILLLNQALAASQLIQGAEFQTKALTPIAQEYLALQQTQQAEKILNQSLQFAQRIETKNSLRRSWVFEPIAVTYAQLGKAATALEIIPSIPEDYYRSQALFAVVKQLAKSNQLAAAQELSQKIVTPEFKGKSLVEIALAAGNQGQANLAAQTFAAALQTAGSDSDADYAQAPLIQTYAKGGRKEAAYTAAQKLKNTEQKAITLGIIANQYSKVGDVQHTKKIIAEMNPLIQTPSAIDSVGFLQNILANAIAEQQYQLAFDLLLLVNRNEFIHRDAWLVRIADAALKDGKTDLVVQIAQGLDKVEIDQRNQILQKLAYTYAQNQQLERALAITKQINNSGNLPYQVQTLGLIATTSRRTPQTDKLLTQAINDARKLALPKRTFGLASVAQSYLKLNNQQQAKKLISEAIQSLQTQKDASVRDYHLQTMAEMFIASKQYPAAVQVLQVMTTELRDYKLPELAILMINNGNEAIDIANILYKNSKNPEIKTRGLINIAESYMRVHKIQPSSKVLDLAFAAAKTIPDPESRVLTFGNPPDITLVDDDGDRASSLEKTALLKAKIGEYNQAVQISQVIQDKNIRTQLIQQLACYRQ